MKRLRRSVPVFPLRLRDSIDRSIELLGEPMIDGQDCYPSELLSEAPPPERDWRHAKFGSMRRSILPGIRLASCDCFVGYRPSTRQIWSLSVADASGTFSTTLEGMPTQGTLGSLVQLFGPPRASNRHRFATIIDVHWWERSGTAYCVEVFREDFDDAFALHQAGDVQVVRVLALDLAPPWEEALAIPSLFS